MMDHESTVNDMPSLALPHTIQRYRLRAWHCAGLALAAFLLCSCGGAPVIKGELPPLPQQPKVVLAPGDVIDVKFRYWPELDESQTIRPDGKISLQLVDAVEAAGLTPEELDQQLTQLYASQLKEPVITVIVRTLVNQRVYVAGEVRRPGPLPLEGKMTLLAAIMAAGGFDNYGANPSNIILFRHVDNNLYATSVDLKIVMSSPESDSFYLAPNDIVFVTRKGIDEANQWVDQHFTRLIPGLAEAPRAIIYTSLPASNTR